MWLEILVANLATNFQDLVAKLKNLVALAPVLGTILHSVTAFLVTKGSRVLKEMASETQVSKTAFSNLIYHKTMLTRFQCCSIKMFPSNGKHMSMTHRKVDVEEPKACYRKGKGKELEEQEERVTRCLVWGQSLFVGCSLWRLHRCQRNMISQGTITKANGKFRDHNLWENKPWNNKEVSPNFFKSLGFFL